MAQSESPAMFTMEEYTTNNGVDIVCYIGDITQAAADGIVTGQGWDLTKPGLVTEALCASAQIPPADFSKIIIGLHKSKHLERGDTFCLSPREHHIRLKFKTVIMAGVLHFKAAWTKNEWKHKMENLYIKILNKANEERLESVALPLLGSGSAEVPFSVAAEALVAALLKYRTKCLSKVFVVSTGGNTHGEIIKQLENYFTAESGPRNKTESTRKPRGYQDKHKVDTKGGNVLGKGNFNQEVNTKEAEGKDNSVGVLENPEMFKKEDYTTNNGVDVICYVGDITQADADGIVTGQVWDLTKRGAVTKQLCDSAQIQPAEFSKIIIGLHKSKHLESGDTCCLSPREHHIRLKFKTVIMAGVFNIKNAQNIDQWKHEMESLYIKILNTANEERLESVALPLLGSGSAEVPLSAAAEALVAALLKFRTKCLSKVFVVSTGGKAHGEIIKQLENYFTAESGPKRKTESSRQPHSYQDKQKGNASGKDNSNQEVSFKSDKGEDNYDEGEDISDKGEDSDDEGEDISDKGEDSDDEGENISDKGEDSDDEGENNSYKGKGNDDEGEDNFYQEENNINSRKDNNDQEDDNSDKEDDHSDQEEDISDKGEDSNDEGEDISDKGEDSDDEVEDISDKGEDSNDEGEDISVKGENNINSRKDKNDQECDNSDKEENNSYQGENDMNSRKDDNDHEEDNINLRKDNSYEGENCTNSGKDNYDKGENNINPRKENNDQAEVDNENNSRENSHGICSVCKSKCGITIGKQPDGGCMKTRSVDNIHCQGYEDSRIIVIDYFFEEGVQTSGEQYLGTRRRGFLPDNEEGRSLLQLLRKAFDHKLTFTIGQSDIAGKDAVIWADISHKTHTHGGQERNGYPDSEYNTRVREQLKQHGVTE